MNKPELLYQAIGMQSFKPMEIWDKLSYSAQMLYCERVIESGNWRKLPEHIIDQCSWLHSCEDEIVFEKAFAT